MTYSLQLNKPLIIFDIESTGLRVASDRIVEIAMIKVLTDGTEQFRRYLINPQMPIPAESTKFHGITDDMVADKPTFKELSGEINAFIGNSDLAGFNSNKFDIPLLVEEFLRAGVQFDFRNRRFVDVQNIFHKMEPRNLRAAYKFYCDEELENAHSAEYDTKATYQILLKQIERYKDVEYVDADGNVSYPITNKIDDLSEFSNVHDTVDLVGHIVYNSDNQPVFNFGKYKGKAVEDVFNTDTSYYDWMMKGDFPQTTKSVITAIKLKVWK